VRIAALQRDLAPGVTFYGESTVRY